MPNQPPSKPAAPAGQPEPSRAATANTSTRSTGDVSRPATRDRSRPPADATDRSLAAGTDPDATDPAEEPVEEPGPEPEALTPEYVARLRREAAEHRRARRAAEAQLAQLRDSEMTRLLERHVAARLANPQDLLVFADQADLVDANGIPEQAKITAAVDALLAERPYLAAQPRPRAGTGDGGSRGTPVPEGPGTIGAMLGRAARGQD